MSKLQLERDEPVAEGVYFSLATVSDEAIAWLWRSRLAYGKLTLLEGPPDVGKSTIALDVAARLSSGRAMPGEDESPSPRPSPPRGEGEGGPAPRPSPTSGEGERVRGPQSVAVLAAEDSFGDTLRPRLLAAGADPEHIFLMPSIIEVDHQEAVTFPKGISALTGLFEDHHVKLVILDPFIAYFGTLNCYHDQHVRRGLAPLLEAARQYSVAVLAIRNWTKDWRQHVLHRGSGALGIVNSARTTLAVLADAAEPEVGVLRVVKSNLAPKPADLRFALEDTGAAARIRWLGAAPNRDEHDSAFRLACDFLKELLVQGPVAAASALTLAQENGISKRTLIRAKTALGVRSDLLRDADGGHWQWRLAG